MLGAIAQSQAVTPDTVAQNDNENQKLTLVATRVPLHNAFREIERKTGLKFMYYPPSVNTDSIVSPNYVQQPLAAILNGLLAPQHLIWRMNGSAIVMKKQLSSVNSSAGDSSITYPTFSGKVTDAEGNPIIGATVLLKGTTFGTATDVNGYFTLTDVKAGSTILISYLGYRPRELAVTSSTVQVKMNLDVQKLGQVDVVYTGYQQLPKERATGSFAQPIKEVYNARVTPDVITRLNGITSGLLFNSNTNLTNNGKLDLSIRGRSTIFANDQPLVVVDNFPYEGDINNINPNDVENITILKDAAAASIWGVRAGNGVIVITTKKGRFNQPLKVTLNASVTAFEKPNLRYDPNYMQSTDLIDVEQQLFGQGFYDSRFSDPSYPALTPVVEILNQQKNGQLTADAAKQKLDALRKIDARNQLKKYFYRNAVNQQYALGFNGGSATNAYAVSVGYDKNLFSQVNNDYQRITLNGVNTFQPIKNLSITAGVNYIRNQTKSDNTLATVQTAFNGYPYMQLTDAQGNPLPIAVSHSSTYNETSQANGFLDWQFNPLQELDNRWNTNTSKTNEIRLRSTLQYTIFPGLTADVNYQYQNTNTQAANDRSVESYTVRNLINQYSIIDADGKVIGYNIPKGDILQQINGNTYSNNIRGSLNFNRSVGQGVLTALAGIEARETKGDLNSHTLYGYNDAVSSFQPVDNVNFFVLNPTGYATIPTGLSIGGTTDRFRSYFANGAYTYQNKYTLSASGRIDQSNYFGVKANHRSVPLWSVGGKWNISSERFYHVDWLSNLQLRATYGINGNLDRSLTAITTFQYNGPAPLTNLVNASINSIGNPELRWEKIGLLNLGLDFDLNNVLSGSLEYYRKKGVDMIGSTIFAPSTGITDLMGNYANIKGQGIDIRLTSKNLSGPLSWSTTLLLSWTQDRVTKYTGKILPADLLSGDISIRPYEGKPVFGVYGYKWEGLDPTNGDPVGMDTLGKTTKDYTSIINGARFQDLVYKGPARPTLFGGLTNILSYKGLSLIFTINYKLGYYFRRNSISYSALFNSYAGHMDYSKRWQQPGDELKTNVPSLAYPADPNRDLFYRGSEILIEKGDHIRLQDINLSYTIDHTRNKNFPFSRLNIYAYANNIGIIWRANHQGLDPDYLSGFPSPRSISFGVKAEF
jgi:TonB-linked SusC/RagA family outer membrane protein